MINTLRRIDRKLSYEDAMTVLRESEYGFLSTINEDGTPHCVPLAFALYNGALYFHCARAGQKLDNLRRDNRAQFTCVRNSRTVPMQFTIEFASCMVDGLVHFVEDEQERMDAMRAICEKYDPEGLDTPSYERIMRGMPAVVMLRMEITALCGKANRGKLG
ncbi:MAG TPA: pyridoxamine 5'-phosphate oxidase family protein [Candidatus Gemmiger avium]|nr:pyridoxamine 5'-phosphate oxidase family protein [Candidatus Gemmiger avium]